MYFLTKLLLFVSFTYIIECVYQITISLEGETTSGDFIIINGHVPVFFGTMQMMDVDPKTYKLALCKSKSKLLLKYKIYPILDYKNITLDLLSKDNRF